MSTIGLVLCHGTFDLFHYGHLSFLKAARKLGTKLVVTVTSDQYVRKGPGRPVYTEYERGEILRALSIVDEVAIIRDRSGVPAIEKYRPSVYVKGGDYAGAKVLEAERQAVERHGGRVVILETPKLSSSDLFARVAKWRETNTKALFTANASGGGVGGVVATVSVSVGGPGYQEKATADA